MFGGLQQGEIAQPGMLLSYSASLFKNLESYNGSLFYQPPLISRNEEVRRARTDIVKASRQVERFSELVRGGIDRNADTVVGPRLRVHPQPDFELLGIEDPEARKRFISQAKRWFNNWAYDHRKLCDAEGDHDFGGLMWLAYRHVTGPDAETFGVIHYEPDRRAEYRTRWATFVTVLDPDRVETPPLQAVNDRVFQGRLMDANGRMIGIYVRQRHPSESGQSENTYTLVPRETDFGRPVAWHYFQKSRGGQKRGITSLVTILRRTTMLDAFDTVYLGAASIRSQLGTYIKTKSSPQLVAENLAPAQAEAADMTYFGQKLDFYGKAKLRIGGSGGGQSIAVLPPDDELKMEAVSGAIEDPGPYRNGIIREIASATGNTFASTAQNYSEANYSSERANKLDQWLGVTRQRVHFTAAPPTLIYAAVIEEAIALGLIEFDPSWPPFDENRAAYCACAWTGPGMGWIDPLKEALAYKELLAMRVTSRQRIAAERGDDILEILDELAMEEAEAEARGIELEPAMPGQQPSGQQPVDDPFPSDPQPQPQGD
ncbi:MAG: phage portal protein [Sphingomonas sp.]|nr:phage portal protein [Sphingomonas sp.]